MKLLNKKVILGLTIAITAAFTTAIPSDSRSRYYGHGGLNRSWSSNGAKGISFNPSGDRLYQFVRLIESQGRVKVIPNYDCPPNLNGSYSPSEVLIRMCVNNFETSGDVLQTLLHEGTHRAQHCRNWKTAFHTPSDLKNTFNALPRYHQKVISQSYDDAYDQILEVEARYNSIDGGSISHWAQEVFFFKLAQSCGGSWAKGYEGWSAGDWDSCKGRPTHTPDGKRCPGK